MARQTSLEKFFGHEFEGPYLYAPSWGLSQRLELGLSLPLCAMVIGGNGPSLGHGLLGVKIRMAEEEWGSRSVESRSSLVLPDSLEIEGPLDSKGELAGQFVDAFGNEAFLVEERVGTSDSLVKRATVDSRFEEFGEAKLLRYRPDLIRVSHFLTMDLAPPSDTVNGRALTEVFGGWGTGGHGMEHEGVYEPELIIDGMFAKLRGVPYPMYLGALRPVRGKR